MAPVLGFRPRSRRPARPAFDVLAGALGVLLILVSAQRTLAASGAPDSPDHAADALAAAIERLVEALRPRLSIEALIRVEIVEINPRVVSVEPPAADRDPFVLSVERAFLEELSADDLPAVVAHELGHVWIFTHHPYLQTEQLANQVAMRVVSRESLERLYQKLWKRTGATGDLSRVLGRE